MQTATLVNPGMIHIDKATTDHIDDIVKIEQACFSTPWSAQSIADSIADANTHILVALVDGVVAGYMGLQIFSGEGYVTNVAVLPEFRGQGVAKALINAQLQNDMEFITLEVRQSNTPAINLYQSFGFEPVGKRPRFYSHPTEDALLLTKYFIKG